MSYKGKFRPSHPKKYKGDPTNIIYRSLWELKFMRYCDTNQRVLKWSSEEIVIPYKSPIDNKYHRYFPDFYIKYVTSNGQVKESLIEIKPAKQVREPRKQKKRTKQYVAEVYEYAKNQAKWEAAKNFCDDRLWEFQIFTEKELGI
jgi:hypothetical protein|tara:strand:+ start:269 stop:703 length:435 start_codon:yes stop_codon:yes gene_type:complete